MKLSVLLRFLFCTSVGAFFSLDAMGQTGLGTIKAARVQGEVLKLTAAGTSTAVKDGEELKESDTVSTGKGASVVLVFMNGSSVRVGAETRLAIEMFRMDPLDEPINPSTLTAEPSQSKTVLNLSYGEMVGDVKKLNTSSSYSIKTPVGAAGIRGTIYRIVFKPSSDGKAFFQIQTAEGLVVMEGVTDADVPVAAGKEVVVEVDSENPTETKVSSAKDIPPADLAALNAVAKELVQVLQNTTVDNSSSQQQETKEEPKPPAPPDPPPPDPTPGAGTT